MTGPGRTALIADDEPLLRAALKLQLSRAWPELEVVAEARNGREAIEAFDALRPSVCFLDVQMPGLSGVDAARHIGRRAHVVFVTAYDHYAVEAFAQGALDYLLKPVEQQRLKETVRRLEERLAAARPAINTEDLIRELGTQLDRMKGTASLPLRWVRAQAGQTLRLIAVEDIAYLRSDTKYTRIAWHDESGEPLEAYVRAPLKDLLAQLDPDEFAQVHRAVVVNLRAVRSVRRRDNDTAEIHLKARKEVLPVSRGYLHLFRQM